MLLYLRVNQEEGDAGKGLLGFKCFRWGKGFVLGSLKDCEFGKWIPRRELESGTLLRSLETRMFQTYHHRTQLSDIE